MQTTGKKLTARAKRRADVSDWKQMAVIRQIRDRAGQVLGHVAAKHDGTPAGMIDAAKAVTERMLMFFDDASNMNSVIIATDAGGAPHWLISPNYRFITEIDARNLSVTPRTILALKAEE